jgi:hypothetical protein
MTTVPTIHFALRVSEPERAACGHRRASRIYVGETVQDESSRRLHGQGATTCRPCRSVMRWNVPVPAPAPVRATVATLSR